MGFIFFAGKGRDIMVFHFLFWPEYVLIWATCGSACACNPATEYFVSLSYCFLLCQQSDRMLQTSLGVLVGPIRGLESLQRTIKNCKL